MYKYLVVLFLLFSFANANELIEGSGVEDIKKENFKNITKFNIKTSIDTTVIKSKNSYYILIGDDNIIDEIDISFTDNELIVSTDKSFKTKSDLKLYIYSDKIRLIRVNGAMDLKLKSLNETSLDIVANGTIDISVMNKSIADKLSIVADGTVDIDFKNLKSRTTKLDLSGVCDVVLNSTNKPNLTSKGICDVVNTYKQKALSKKNINEKKMITQKYKANTKTKATKKYEKSDSSSMLARRISTDKKSIYQRLISLINENQILKFQEEIYNTNPNVFNKYNPTLLYQSAIQGRKEFVELLIHKGVDDSCITGKYKETALQGSIRNNKMDIVSYLIYYSKNLNIKNSQGETALHMTTRNGMNSMIQLLLDRGADRRIKNNSGETAYDIANGMMIIDSEILKQLKIKTLDSSEEYIKSNSKKNMKGISYYNTVSSSKRKILKSNLNVYIGK